MMSEDDLSHVDNTFTGDAPSVIPEVEHVIDNELIKALSLKPVKKESYVGISILGEDGEMYGWIETVKAHMDWVKQTVKDLEGKK